MDVDLQFAPVSEPDWRIVMLSHLMTPGPLRVQEAIADAMPASVVVTDADGQQVRAWQVELRRGVNTLTWHMQARRNIGELRDAAPGRYEITIQAGGERASNSIDVVADPILR